MLENCMTGNICKETLIRDCVIHEKQLKFIKQVTVTDEDPLKNVREVYESNDAPAIIAGGGFGGSLAAFGTIYNYFMDLQKALGEDIKNLDKGVKNER
jgi:hypothetical protein